MPRRLKSRASEHALESSPPRRRRRRGTVNLRRQVCTKSDTELALDYIRAQGVNGRAKLEDFYRFVIKHEITKADLEPAPHQKVMFSFIEHHPRAVFRIPIGCAKTFSMAAASLWLMGNDQTVRGAILSKTQGQAAKVLAMVSDYITEPALNGPLAITFPKLQKSPRTSDPWTANRITVARPPGIRDPSLMAAGLETSIGGARLSWIVCDDTIDIDNSSTPDAREKARINLEGRIMSRLDPKGSKAVFTNTPWDRDDATYYLEEELEWPTIQMDIYGNIRVTNADASWLHMAEREYLRHSNDDPDNYRLRAHDPDPDEQTPLWPDRYTLDEIEEIRQRSTPHEFARLYLCEPFDSEAARCHKDWIEKCKLRGIGTSMVHTYDGPNPTFTGLDLAIGKRKKGKGKHDRSCFFTFELLPDNSRRLLNIESGRWSSPVLVDMIDDMHARYGSMIVVESNQAQDFIRQWADPAINPNAKYKDLIVKAHTTTHKNKVDESFGVESIFNEMRNGAWIIPCDSNGDVHKEVKIWIRSMLEYMPHKHTGDHLMACFPGGARVTTKHGLVPIEQIRVDDEVLTHRGSWKKVTGLESRPYDGSIEIVKACGQAERIFATSEHPFYAAESSTIYPRVVPEEWGWTDASDLHGGRKTDGMWLLAPHATWPAVESEIDLARFVPMQVAKHGASWRVTEDLIEWRDLAINRHLRIDQEMAVLLGLYLAEGSVGGTNGDSLVTWAYNAAEHSLHDFTARKVSDVFSADARLDLFEGSNRASVRVHSVIAGRFFKEFGKRADKCLPWEMMGLSSVLQLSILAGWLLGDGSLDKHGRLSGVSTSENMILQMQQIAMCAGFHPQVNVFEPGGSREVFKGTISQLHRSWRLTFPRHETADLVERVPAIVREVYVVGAPERSRSNTRSLQVSEGLAVRINDVVTEQFRGDVYNLHVEGDHSYVVEGVAVHNCWIARERARRSGRRDPLPTVGRMTSWAQVSAHGGF